jgi:ribonuclease BN (tRNA processing enzyme)
VAVGPDGGPPSLILDAGTGLRRLPDCLDGKPLEGSILLGHLHWDHTQGLPFCPSADRPDARVDLYLPSQGDAEKVLSGAMGPPHFPIEPAQLRGAWSFHSLEAGSHTIEGFEVLALEIPHKGGRTFGFRISDGTASIAYLSDHQPTAVGAGEDGVGEYHDAAVQLVSGVDLLIHDAQYTPEEFPSRRDWGHSTIEYPIRLAQRCGVKKVWLYHHAPARTDDELDAIVAEARSWATVEVEAAAEGATAIVPAGT